MVQGQRENPASGFALWVPWLAAEASAVVREVFVGAAHPAPSDFASIS